MPAETPIVAASRTERQFFTLEQANRSLTYVRRIVRDVRDAYREAIAVQHRLEYPLPEADLESLSDRYDRVMERLNAFTDELSDVGVELKDYEAGLIDFPAWFDGREVCLCWKLGEERIVSWHETDAGFAGRQPIADLEPDDEDED